MMKDDADATHATILYDAEFENEDWRAMWAQLCKVFFRQSDMDLWGDEDPSYSVALAIQVLTVFEHTKVENYPTKFPEAESILMQLGFENKKFHWYLDDSRSEVFHQIKNEVRQQYHREASVMRDKKFDEALNTLRNRPLARGVDLEQATFTETVEMANNQRHAIRNYLSESKLQTLIVRLHEVLTMLLSDQEFCVSWHLTDNCLTEYGLENALAFIDLVVVHLRSSVEGDAQSRTYVVGSSLSNKRISRLLELFPSKLRSNPASISNGKISLHLSNTRINVIGLSDAVCDEDYGILYWCNIL